MRLLVALAALATAVHGFAWTTSTPRVVARTRNLPRPTTMKATTAAAAAGVAPPPSAGVGAVALVKQFAGASMKTKLIVLAHPVIAVALLWALKSAVDAAIRALVSLFKPKPKPRFFGLSKPATKARPEPFFAQQLSLPRLPSLASMAQPVVDRAVRLLFPPRQQPRAPKGIPSGLADDQREERRRSLEVAYVRRKQEDRMAAAAATMPPNAALLNQQKAVAQLQRMREKIAARTSSPATTTTAVPAPSSVAVALAPQQAATAVDPLAKERAEREAAKAFARKVKEAQDAARRRAEARAVTPTAAKPAPAVAVAAATVASTPVPSPTPTPFTMDEGKVNGLLLIAGTLFFHFFLHI